MTKITERDERIAQWQAMSDRERDAAVARDVMGCNPVRENVYSWHENEYVCKCNKENHCDGGYLKEEILKRYTTDMNAAFEAQAVAQDRQRFAMDFVHNLHIICNRIYPHKWRNGIDYEARHMIGMANANAHDRALAAWLTMLEAS